ncbi:MAG: sigma-70 family RNA polymerase sigma factor [Candidatus Izemoplasmatales bacterium]
MIFSNYNDFEIINLIKEGNEEAFQFMVDKYQYLIAKKIKSFNLACDYDDCFQEALMLLHRSVIKFDEGYNKTFTRYFELNLNNFLITYKNKQIRYINFKVEKLPIICDFFIKEEDKLYFRDEEIFEALNALSDFEKVVYQAKIIENRSIKECAIYLACDEKRIYNALDRIRKKIKLYLIT